jgi:hypothetical protein
MTPTCKCGRPLGAGRTCNRKGNTICLICQTAWIFRDWFYPASQKVQRKDRVRREAAREH